MKPAFSVIFLTTLIGVAQGLVISLGFAYFSDFLTLENHNNTFNISLLIAIAFMIGGLGAAVFHLGKPSYFITRAWRGITQWRTSWLSRELIAIPAFIAILIGLTFAIFFKNDFETINTNLISGLFILAIGVSFILFLCTAMIYASIKFLQEWNHPLTVINFTLFGLLSGVLAFICILSYQEIHITNEVIFSFIALSAIAFITRAVSVWRNKHIKHRSSLKSATGLKHEKIEQKSMGFMGGSFNTKEFFHKLNKNSLITLLVLFNIMTFIIPIFSSILIRPSLNLFIALFIIQFLGLLMERYYFFTEGKHPQNIYYQNKG
mgnify:CR=1 FL=1